jgi:hypothetical protein
MEVSMEIGIFKTIMSLKPIPYNGILMNLAGKNLLLEKKIPWFFSKMRL